MTQKQRQPPAEVFRAMAARIEKNPEEFAGAYVIMAPDGRVISHSFFDPMGDPVAFWAFASAQVQVAQVEAQQADEANNGYGLGMIRR